MSDKLNKIKIDNVNYDIEDTAAQTAVSNINVYVSEDGKLHFVDKDGADSELPFSKEGDLVYNAETGYIQALTTNGYAINIGKIGEVPISTLKLLNNKNFDNLLFTTSYSNITSHQVQSVSIGSGSGITSIVTGFASNRWAGHFFRMNTSIDVTPFNNLHIDLTSNFYYVTSSYPIYVGIGDYSTSSPTALTKYAITHSYDKVTSFDFDISELTGEKYLFLYNQCYYAEESGNAGPTTTITNINLSV